jgi:hypothetical protein
MKRDLVEGYLFEVTKSLPRRDRKEIYEKLGPEIYDRIEITKKDNTETKEEVLAVLKEYGDPADVAASYSHRGRRALVPQPHYAGYNRDKGMSYLVAILSLLGINAFIHFFVESFPMNLDGLLRIVFDFATAILVIFISYTVAFSAVSGSRVGDWNRFAKSLRSEPKSSARVGIFEISFQVILSTLLFVIFGLSADILGLNYTGIITRGGWRISLIIPIVAAYFLNVINIATKEVDKRYTFSVLFTTILTNLAVVSLAFLIFVKDEAVSSNFREWLSDVIPANDFTLTLISNLGLVIFLIVTIFAAIDLITSALSYHADKKSSVEPIRSTSKKPVYEDEVLVTSEDFKDESYHSVIDTPIEAEDMVVTTPEDLDEMRDTVIIDAPEDIDDRIEYDKTFVEDEVVYSEPEIYTDSNLIDEDLFETKVISKSEMDNGLEEDLTNTTAPKTIADHIRDANPNK